MSSNYDAIVIGGGHNGLVSAAYLAVLNLDADPDTRARAVSALLASNR
jgi:glycine/D-amino acid oxidase-like deaminating enzyme